MVMRKITAIFFCFISIGLFAQGPHKKALSIEDFEKWNTLKNYSISNDGKIVAFEQSPQQGDGMLVVVSEKKQTDTIPRGYNAQFGPENDFLAFHIKQPESTIRKAKRAKTKKEDMPGDSLGIWTFNSGNIVKFSRLKSFQVPEENAKWIAFSLEPEPASKDSASNQPKEKQKQKDVEDLVLFRVATSDTMMFRNVSEWFYARKGAAIYFNRQVKDSTDTFSSLYSFDTSSGEVTQLFNAKGWVKKITAGETGEEYAFLFSQDTIKEKVYSLYLGEPDKSPEMKLDRYSRGIPVGWSPSENGNMYFSEDGTKLFFGTAESPEPAEKDTLLEDEKPKLDIWNWQDLKLQPQQKVELEKEKKRTYLAVYHLELGRFIQLADLQVRNITTIQKGNGEIALGYNEQPYLRETSWTGKQCRDYYVVDIQSGIKREIVDKKSFVRISPQGKYVLWYEPSDSSYYARSTDINNLEAVPLTKMIPVSFFDERNDKPTDPNPYGIAGWSEDDRFVYIYDRYDIWKIDPSGERVPANITKAFGRRNETRFRYVSLDPDLKYIPSNETVLLNAFDERTMSNGFFSVRFNAVKEPDLLTMERVHFANVRKAKKAEKLIWTKESARIFPDVWTSDLDFDHARKISDANPQQEQYIWPKVQIVEWLSFSGEKLKGLLYLPENLDFAKKYPLIVYFYERNTENIHRHQHPAPSRSVINKTFYTSNDYIVFVPDITYKTGYPGQSAYDAIVSGTQYLVNSFPYINEKKMALQGQSWGGYQTAYLITKTNLYAAAMAGAPVSNMTSAYGGIRWQSGMSRMFQYEQSQSRIGGTLWEKPLHYIENSPLFFAPDIKTPLLMMHNDNDGAVPWYQGIELFVALRRLDKPVWMLTYNNEPHNLKATSWGNRIDLSKRMYGFFNHYLKGHPAPAWMEKGIPALEKGEDLGY
jgi:dipeptidyl aminopeptidase/acylaminoacyl peptidase